VEVFGTGVLINGRSGVGKSETALELIVRGHTLVADDSVRITCLGERLLEGSCPEVTRRLIEVRGLGIIDVCELFGVRSVRARKIIDLVITLTPWKPDMILDRTGLKTDTYEVLGVDLPHIELPVQPGRNLATIVEVATRNLRARQMGLHAAARLDDWLRSESIAQVR
jgi:HPr kinase/phosphorylase